MCAFTYLSTIRSSISLDFAVLMACAFGVRSAFVVVVACAIGVKKLDRSWTGLCVDGEKKRASTSVRLTMIFFSRCIWNPMTSFLIAMAVVVVVDTR